MRLGLMPTPLTVTRALGWAAPATSQNAAPLMSEGTWMSRDFRLEGRTATLSPSLSTSAPIAAIMRSVWSRDSAGCMTDVSPSAYIPAMRMQDFSCALATGISYSMPLSPPPLNARGASDPPPLPLTSAPIRLRGSRMRFMGRRRREESPLMTLKKGWLASRPETSRIVVPLLPE